MISRHMEEMIASHSVVGGDESRRRLGYPECPLAPDLSRERNVRYRPEVAHPGSKRPTERPILTSYRAAGPASALLSQAQGYNMANSLGQLLARYRRILFWLPHVSISHQIFLDAFDVS